MHIMRTNPEIVQSEDWFDPDKTSHTTPVFLMHDGGGTTFAYHCLNPLKRYVYGIQNPYFRTGQIFEEGIPQMARLYSMWIRTAVLREDFPVKKRDEKGRVDILLGGWSLGGLLSLEMARQMADDRIVRVVGILMIDCAYPEPAKRSSALDLVSAQANTAPAFCGPSAGDDDLYDGAEATALGLSLGAARQKNRILSQRCMAHAVQMVSQWDPPQWDGPSAAARPKAILLRAKSPVPTAPGAEPLTLDRNRGSKTLGWDAYAEGMFAEVMDIEGHHFDIFAESRLDGISETIKAGLDKLDGGGSEGIGRGRGLRTDDYSREQTEIAQS